MAMEAEAAARAAAAMATAAAAMATAAAAMAAAEKVVEVVEVVEVVRLMGARSLTEGWAVARQKRARMQRRAVRSSRR
jgi:acyl CoA:acetate/3-ketoacid CoA transferase alpha subunit